MASDLERENETEAAFETEEVREAAAEFARVEEESKASVGEAVKDLELATEMAFKDQSDESFASVTAAEAKLLEVMERTKKAKRDAAQKLSSAKKSQARKPLSTRDVVPSMAQNRPGPKRRPPSSKSRSQLMTGLLKDPSSLQVTLMSSRSSKNKSSERKSKTPRTVDFHHMPSEVLEVLELHMSMQQQKQLEEASSAGGSKSSSNKSHPKKNNIVGGEDVSKDEAATAVDPADDDVSGSFITRSVGRTLDESVV